jgi:Cu(I)/Ag(I) efflux system membrane protein CusA/SilA
VYLKQAIAARAENGIALTPAVLDESLREGAVLRVRPKAMTVAVIVAGRLPIFAGSGAGSEVMSRIAAPMVGGMLTAPLLSLLVIPAAYRLIRARQWASRPRSQSHLLRYGPVRYCSSVTFSIHSTNLPSSAS